MTDEKNRRDTKELRKEWGKEIKRLFGIKRIPQYDKPRQEQDDETRQDNKPVPNILMAGIEDYDQLMETAARIRKKEQTEFPGQPPYEPTKAESGVGFIAMMLSPDFVWTYEDIRTSVLMMRAQCRLYKISYEEVLKRHRAYYQERIRANTFDSYRNKSILSAIDGCLEACNGDDATLISPNKLEKIICDISNPIQKPDPIIGYEVGNWEVGGKEVDATPSDYISERMKFLE